MSGLGRHPNLALIVTDIAHACFATARVAADHHRWRENPGSSRLEMIEHSGRAGASSDLGEGSVVARCEDSR
jgi:hypothetical protein